MAPRANWNGYLKLSLVSCAIALYPASSTSQRISFNTINRKTGNKVRRIYIDPDSHEEVESADQVKGYAVSKDTYVLIEDEDLDALKIESSHTIDIGKFVPRHEIDPRYMDVPYYIVPNDKVAQEAFAVIREAMREADVVGIGRVVISRRERVIMLEPFERGMLGTVLRYGYEVRAAAAYFDDIPNVSLPEEMKGLAKVIIDRRAGAFDAAEFTDRYEDAVADMVRAKQAGSTVRSSQAAPNASNVIDLMEALRKSIGGAMAPASKAAKGTKATAADVSQIPAKSAEPSKTKKKAASDKQVAGGKKGR